MKFRALRADEIECRVGVAKEGKGVSLLLYKDARCDMNVLDETVGSMNWQKRYSRDNANCEVGIWDDDKGQWVWKEDTGTESRTEAEKGLASDSFKRACFNWGIGRELYTAPFIWIQGATKYDRFWVKEMTVEDRKITHLVICSCDQYGNRIEDVAYEYPRQTRSNATRAKKSSKTEKSTAEKEKPLTGEERAAQAYPERNVMIESILKAIKPEVTRKWIEMWQVDELALATDAMIQNMYRYYDEKGAFREQQGEGQEG